MVNLNRVSIDTNALVLKCNEGVLYSNDVALCNVTRTSLIPYVRLEISEEIDGVVKQSGFAIVWGKINSQREVQWPRHNIQLMQKAILNGPRAFQWVMALVKHLPSVQVEQFINEPDIHLYEYLISILPNFNPDENHGEFYTRNVEPYTDSSSELKSSYTCFLFPWESTSEEKINRSFKYHNKTVVSNAVTTP